MKIARLFHFILICILSLQTLACYWSNSKDNVKQKAKQQILPEAFDQEIGAGGHSVSEGHSVPGGHSTSTAQTGGRPAGPRIAPVPDRPGTSTGTGRIGTSTASSSPGGHSTSTGTGGRPAGPRSASSVPEQSDLLRGGSKNKCPVNMTCIKPKCIPTRPYLEWRKMLRNYCTVDKQIRLIGG